MSGIVETQKCYVIKWEDEAGKQHTLRTLTPVGDKAELRVVLRSLEKKDRPRKYTVIPDEKASDDEPKS